MVRKDDNSQHHRFDFVMVVLHDTIHNIKVYNINIGYK